MKLVRSILLALTFCTATVVVAPTASAYHGWHQSTCDSNVWWIYAGGGAYDFWDARHGRTVRIVPGPIMNEYAARGWECGNVGTPLETQRWTSDGRVLYQVFNCASINKDYINGQVYVFYRQCSF